MTLQISANVLRAVEPPIAEAQSWINGRNFSDEKPLLNLAQAVPSYPPAPSLSEHLSIKVKQFETAQYTAIAGIPELRSSLAQHMAEIYLGQINSRNVLISAGCNQAYCLAIMATAQAGDEVILPTPYYFNHVMWLEMLGISPVFLPFRSDLHGVPSVDDAAKLMTKKTKAIVLVTPNNPTGAIYPPEVIQQFFDLAFDNKIALIIDETYKDFLGNTLPHPVFKNENWEETLIQLYSFSKVFSLTGYRVGSIVAGHQVIEAVTKIMDTLAICAPRISQDAALFGLKELKEWVAEKQATIKDRLKYIENVFRTNDLDYTLISSGAYFAYVKHPFKNLSSHDLAQKLAEQENILCLPGSFFGPNQDTFLRIAFANATIEELSILPDRLHSSISSISVD
ncbi:MAG: aspartate aminotransferase [Rhodospirillaceae bacterium]|nr:aspartate aminotransferase [Rhodospirillaceae bacterium]